MIRSHRAVASAVALGTILIAAELSAGSSARAQADASAALSDAETDAGAAPAPFEYGAAATATRSARPLRETAAQLSVIPRAEIALNPTLTTDSLVRSLPSVATFRRSSSLTADPSSQGVNLRGVGPSGVSRSLVLLDGVPVNDPFAGSVYFRALPRLGLDRVEVVPGGGSALYGSSALSGVMQLFTRSAEQRAVDGELSYGSLQTWLLTARAASSAGPVSGSVEGEWLRSSGYNVVRARDRGPIDQRAQSQHGTAHGKLNFRLNKRLLLSASGSFFRETLDRSTRYTSAAVRLGTAALRLRYAARRRGSVDVLAFGRLVRFDQGRARIAAERASEERAARQRVPAGDLGGSITWASGAPDSAQGHQVLLGSDARYADGTSHERLYPPQPGADSLRTRSAGGSQLLWGAFAADVWRLGSYVQLEGALRFDLIHDDHGAIEVERFSGARTTTRFANRNRFAVNPRLGILLEPVAWLRLRASAYRAFRAATLNELYRPFQVGTVLTAPNPRLRPETLSGGELGFELCPWQALQLRATGFFNLLDDPIVNRTLGAPLPDGSTRQRENLGRARIAGLELSADLRLFARLSLLLAYTLADSRVTRQGAAEGLKHKRLAQDPVHRASALLLFDEPAWFRASLQLRYVGPQYEDDLNTLRMRGYAVVDALLARQLVWHLELFAAVENLFDRTYLVGRAGVNTIGAPFMARVGLRLREPKPAPRRVAQPDASRRESD